MTTMTDTQYDKLQEIGRNAMASIREMVAALEVDYDRLQELRQDREYRQERLEELRDARTDLQEDGDDLPEDQAAELAELEGEWTDAEKLAELEEAAGECEDDDDARQRIHEDPLSIQYRSGWASSPAEFEAQEYEILLGTGGPAVRILGEIGGGCVLQTQDWGTQWTDYHGGDADDRAALEAYVDCLGVNDL